MTFDPLNPEAFRQKLLEAGVPGAVETHAASAVASANGHQPSDTGAVGVLINEDDIPKDRVPNPMRATVGGRGDNDTLILAKGTVQYQDTACRLFGALTKTRKFFQKGGAVLGFFDPTKYHPTKGKGKKAAPSDDNQGGLRLIGPGELRSVIEKYFVTWTWVKEDKRPTLRETLCSDDQARALLKTEEVYLLPPINTTPSAPIAIEGENGELEILERGYHDFNGGTFIKNNVKLPEVSLEEALKTINDMFSEFDWQTPSDRSRAIANLISPALSMGQFVDGWVPVDVAEADKSQAGKGMRHRMMLSIYHERAYVITARVGGVGSVDESLSKALLSGRTFIRFDNVRGNFSSQLLESLITDGEGNARVPHREEVPVSSKGLYFMLTSNGVNSTEDFANRSCIVRIRKREGFNYKDYPEGKLEKHVEANRDHYLACVFSVLREWIRQGKLKNKGETRHDSRDWIQTVDWIVQNIFKAPPVMDGHLEAQKRVSNPALNFVRALCIAAEADDRMDETWKATEFVNLANNHNITIPGHKVENEDDAKRQVGVQLGQAFGKAEKIEIDGFRVTRKVENERRSDGNGCREIKTYIIEKCHETVVLPRAAGSETLV
jgi:hypothetical protein